MEAPENKKLKVFLVANYENDRQESMLRFARLLECGLRQESVDVEILRPRPFFGLLKHGATGLAKWLGYIDKFLIFPGELKRRLPEAESGTVFHILDHSNAMYVFHLAKAHHLVTCNDLLAVRSAMGAFPRQRTKMTGRILQRWILGGLKKAHRITCISEATSKDLLALLDGAPVKVDVTHMGLNSVYYPMSRAEAQERLQAKIGNEPFILHVGGNQWYKNRLGVLAIHNALFRAGCRIKLIMAGAPFDDAMRAFLGDNPESAANVISLSNVDDETLRALYSSAELLVFPSFEEGFGWPIIEAQACGCRVAVTGKPPMTEVAGDAAFFLPDPPQETDLLAWSEASAQVVKLVLAQNAAERERMIAAGLENAAHFSVKGMVHRYVEIYRELIYKA